MKLSKKQKKELIKNLIIIAIASSGFLFVIFTFGVSNLETILVGNRDLIDVIMGISLTLSLIFLAYQVFMERGAIKRDTYEKLRSDSTNISLFLAEHTEIELYLYKNSEDTNLKDYKMAYYYLDALLGLCERAYVSQGQTEWEQWRNWLAQMKESNLFQEIVEDCFNDRLYDDDFLCELLKIGDYV